MNTIDKTSVSVSSVNLKLSQELKNQIKKQAEENNQTVSKFIRELLIEYLDGTLYDNELAFYRGKEYINSTEFLQLVVWMYTKKNEQNCTSTESQLNSYISTLKKTEHNLPKDLVKEFDKVLLDTMRVINEESSANKYFKFSDALSYSPTFDFIKFEDYILNDLKLLNVVTIK